MRHSSLVSLVGYRDCAAMTPSTVGTVDRYGEVEGTCAGGSREARSEALQGLCNVCVEYSGRDGWAE